MLNVELESVNSFELTTNFNLNCFYIKGHYYEQHEGSEMKISTWKCIYKLIQNWNRERIAKFFRDLAKVCGWLSALFEMNKLNIPDFISLLNISTCH